MPGCDRRPRHHRRVFAEVPQHQSCCRWPRRPQRLANWGRTGALLSPGVQASPDRAECLADKAAPKLACDREGCTRP